MLHPAHLAVLEGCIVCALCRHVLGGLVGAPLWLMFALAGFVMLALARTRCGASSLIWIVIGALCGLTLPASLPPARDSVVPHPPLRFAHTDLFDALTALDDNPQAIIGRRISVTGSWHPPRNQMPAAVSRRVMACCAADSIDAGFDVDPSRGVTLPEGTQVRVSGVVRPWLRDGETRYALRDASVSVSPSVP